MGLLKKFIPNYIEKTIFDVDFKKIYESGKRYILSDLDNTLLPYDLEIATPDIKNWINDLQELGFTLIILSNNHKDRVEKFSNDLNLKYFNTCRKPLKRGFKKALKYIKIEYLNNESNDIKDKVITLGDQLMTDIFGSSRMKLDSILVHPIKKKSEHWYTRLNRRMEKFVVSRIKKKYPMVFKELEEKHEY